MIIDERICASIRGKIMSAEQAADMIGENMVVGCSGFTMAGYPKTVPQAMARLGKAKNLTLLTGASVGDTIDGELVRSGLLKRRFPYQTNAEIRNAINRGEVQYTDMHLSHMPTQLNQGIGPHIDFALIECAAVTENGLIPTRAAGASDSFVRNADKVIVEVNERVPLSIAGIHDFFQVSTPDRPKAVPIYNVSDRTGELFIPCPPEKIAAIVVCSESGEFPEFREPDETSAQIARNIVMFLKQEVAAGRQPENLGPIQSGVGSVANAVLSGLAEGGFKELMMYTEVMQDSALDLISTGVIRHASATALSLSREKARELYANIDFFKERIVLRPQEISNHPEIVRRLGLISMNTPIECDLFGHVNSTHIMGTEIVNGLGGSGDFARNAGLTMFAAPSTAKSGRISTIVPMVSHVDHTEHDVMVMVTEHGVADLRWKTPAERAELIIENCAHPKYREGLREYLKKAGRHHIPHDLDLALSWHKRYLATGSM